MNELIAEIGLRLAKVAAATIVGLLVWVLSTGPLGGAPSVELALLCWLSGAALVLLVETSPL